MKFEVTMEMVVGNNKLDQETAIVLEKMNVFCNYVHSNKNNQAYRDTEKLLFKDLLDFIDTVFDDEEKLMNVINYEYIDKHLDEHNKLLNVFKKVNDKMNIDSSYIIISEVIKELEETLCEFLINHVKIEDRKLVEALIEYENG